MPILRQGAGGLVLRTGLLVFTGGGLEVGDGERGRHDLVGCRVLREHLAAGQHRLFEALLLGVKAGEFHKGCGAPRAFREAFLEARIDRGGGAFVAEFLLLEAAEIEQRVLGEHVVRLGFNERAQQRGGLLRLAREFGHRLRGGVGGARRVVRQGILLERLRVGGRGRGELAVGAQLVGRQQRGGRLAVVGGGGMASGVGGRRIERDHNIRQRLVAVDEAGAEQVAAADLVDEQHERVPALLDRRGKAVAVVGGAALDLVAPELFPVEHDLQPVVGAAAEPGLRARGGAVEVGEGDRVGVVESAAVGEEAAHRGPLGAAVVVHLAPGHPADLVAGPRTQRELAHAERLEGIVALRVADVGGVPGQRCDLQPVHDRTLVADGVDQHVVEVRGGEAARRGEQDEGKQEMLHWVSPQVCDVCF